MNRYNPDTLEAALAKQLSAGKLDGTEFLASETWGHMKELTGTLLHLAAGHIETNDGDHPLFPTIVGQGADGRRVFAAVPDLLDPDIRIRKAIIGQIPMMLKQMECEIAIFAQEAWTLELKPPKNMSEKEARETFSHIVPSEHDARVSAVICQFISKDHQFMICFKINEKAQRSLNYEPFNVIVVKFDGKMRSGTMPDLAPA